MSSPKEEQRVIIKGERVAPQLWERKQLIDLLTKIARRLQQEKQDDNRKSA
ncbi:MAG: hypothetical protein AAF846_22345 [Chloroflexota bacterium]